MRRLTLVSLVLLFGCKKGDSPTPRAEPKAEGAGTVAIRSEPVVKLVEAQYFEKEGLTAEQGTFKAQVKNGEAPIETKVFIYKPGADLEETKPVKEEWSGRDTLVAPGTYDILIFYDAGPVAKAKGWLRAVEIKPKHLLRARVTIDFQVGRLRVNVANAGQSVDDKSRVGVYKPGADAQESRPIIEEWAGRDLLLPSGKYDVLVRYHESNVNDEKWLRGIDVPGGYQLRKETAAIEAGVGFVKVNATNNGEDVNGLSRFAVWKAGADAKETRPLTEDWAGRDFNLLAGTYDIRVTFKASDWAVREEWIKGVVIEGKREKKVETAKFTFELVKVKVDVAEGEKPANDRGHFTLYAAGKSGEDDRAILDVWGGTKVIVPAGAYDLKARLTPAGGGAEKVKWEKGLTFKGGEPVEKKIAF